MKSKHQSAVKAKGNGKAAANSAGILDNVEAPADYDECRHEQMIAVAAHFRAEQRGFAPGNDLSDWFQAEAELKH